MPDNEVSTQEVSTGLSSAVATNGIKGNFESQVTPVEDPDVGEDINPRSPKRRRLSPSEDDADFDIGAAAARALALSLGKDISDIDVPTSLSTTLPGVVAASQPSTNNAVFPIEYTRESRVGALPNLHELASQILHYLAKLNHLEIGEMLFGPPSPRSQEYRALRQKFDDAKRPFVIGSSPFLSPFVLGMSENEQVEMIRRVNLAIFMASIFSGEIGLRIMDINFLDVFVPEGGRLLKAQGAIYLELKTHAFMAATRTASAMLSQVMTDLFPPDMDTILLRKRPGAKTLAPSEQDFLNRLGSRRDILYSVIRSNKLNTLPDTYRWNDFAREVSIYLTKHMENGTSGGKDGSDMVSHPGVMMPVPQGQMENQFSVNQALGVAVDTSVVPSASEASDQIPGLDMSFDIEAMVAQAARAAALSMGAGIDMSLLPSSSLSSAEKSHLNQNDSTGTTNKITSVTNPAVEPSISHNETKTQFQIYEPIRSANDLNGASLDPNNVEIPHSSQTAPTQVLYELARQVTTNKVLNSKKVVPPTHRRPWTTEEENALMTGLDQVKGPHWSQILAMYGPGGTINESLKDRNQVQLKDKARNLKLFFLKAGIEVPYYLQAVTGDLRTRAPGQAEKMERERLQGEGDRASQDDLNGIADLTDLADGELEVEAEAEDSIEATPNSDQLNTEQNLEHSHLDVEADEAAFDMEAIIAQAAASASQGLGPPT